MHMHYLYDLVFLVFLVFIWGPTPHLGHLNIFQPAVFNAAMQTCISKAQFNLDINSVHVTQGNCTVISGKM